MVRRARWETFLLTVEIREKADGGEVGREERVWCKIVRKWKRDEGREGDEKEAEKGT